MISDFGGVLTTPLERSFRFFADRSGIPLERLGEAMSALQDRLGQHPLFELEIGAMTEARFYELLGEELGVEITGFAEEYFSHLGVEEEMIAAIARWRDAGLRMAMCTNNVREWEPRWRAMLPVDELFEIVVDSAFVGVRKPDVRIYEIVLERLGDVGAEECVFVDDREDNCAAARDLGMWAVHFRDAGQAIAEVEELRLIR